MLVVILEIMMFEMCLKLESLKLFRFEFSVRKLHLPFRQKIITYLTYIFIITMCSMACKTQPKI